MKTFKRFALNHLIVFLGLSLAMVSIVFIMGLFTEMHEDAYMDGFMSIVYVYAIILVGMGTFKLLRHKVSFTPTAWPNRLFVWYRQSGILINIAIAFTLITIVNSFMMVAGIDTPKTGSFAYLHLLVRLSIVTLAVSLAKADALIRSFKIFKDWLSLDESGRTMRFPSNVKSKIQTLFRNPWLASNALFTFITASGCLVVVAFSPFLNVSGGAWLYTALIILYAFLFMASLLLRTSPESRTRSD